MTMASSLTGWLAGWLFLTWNVQDFVFVSILIIQDIYFDVWMDVRLV